MNYNFADATLDSVSVHKVGNKAADEPLFTSQHPLDADEELKIVLTQYFLTNFKSEEYYRLYHDSDLMMNEVYHYVSRIFEDNAQLHDQSKHLARHLFNQSLHPKIKGGEFYVALFKNCFWNGESVEAVGLFKSENKDVFLEVETHLEGVEIESKEGVNINKLDKGCIIFNIEKENGYFLSIIDNTNKGNEAQFWKDDFLNVLILNNEFHQTGEFLSLTKKFVTDQIKEDFDISKADQIDLLNRSVHYFKSHQSFDQKEFEEEVFAHENVIESFRNFNREYREENAIEIPESFDISMGAVKKQARIFKSVLKLDKNFHIYIHGDRNLIEQGIENDGRKFYKIYFNNET